MTRNSWREKHSTSSTNIQSGDGTIGGSYPMLNIELARLSKILRRLKE